jgi:hypothetical protein
MSSYIFKGRLCGLICAECPEPLSNVKVRLYRLRGDQNAVALAVANPKDTLAAQTDEAVQAKAQALLAEVETDAEGRFTVELGEKNRYNGEAFEVDVYCGTVPRQRPGRIPPRPRQLSVTTVQPLWRQNEDRELAVWEYCIPYRFWCYFRGLFGAWTICGKVVTCDNKVIPVSNVKVSAFDADWLQDDALGSAVTDGAGKFRIDYSTADFQKTIFSPLINVELTGGPDLYFMVETSGAQPLLDETQARGRQPDRENVGPCFCVTLCVDVQQQPPVDDPLFTDVGDFHIYGDIDPATGLTKNAVFGHGGPGYGFFGALKLRGFCPKQISAQPARYRFRYEELAAPGLTPITGTAVYPVLVGSRSILWDTFGTGLAYTFQSIYIQGSGATPDPTPPPMVPPGTAWGSPPAHVIVPDANGWIEVDPNGLDGGFYGPLVRFDTTRVLAALDAPGSGAGNPPANPKNGVALRIVFEAGPVSASPNGPVAFTNELARILVNNWGEVRLLDLEEFSSGGMPCAKITNAINIQYTVDHELIASWGVGISSAAAFPPPPPLPSGSTPRGQTGTHFVNVNGWPACAYIVTLDTRRRLTDGENDDSDRTIQKVFCK